MLRNVRLVVEEEVVKEVRVVDERGKVGCMNKRKFRQRVKLLLNLRLQHKTLKHCTSQKN